MDFEAEIRLLEKDKIFLVKTIEKIQKENSELKAMVDILIKDKDDAVKIIVEKIVRNFLS